MITIYPNILHTETPTYYDIETVYKAIKSEGVKTTIDEIRLYSDKATRNELKKRLPAICFSGKFSKRGNSNCLEHSGYVALDFDHVDNFEQEWNKLKGDKHTCLMFTSPSGDGIKVIVKIPKSIPEHPYYCKALFEYFDSIYLDNFEDIARVCYASADKNAYFNPDSLIFTKKIIPNEQKEIIRENEHAETNPEKVYNNLVNWLNRQTEFKDGNKHNYIVRLIFACNRFGLDADLVINKLIFNYQNKATYVPDEYFIEKVNSIYKKYKLDFNTAFFEKDEAYNEDFKQLGDEVFDVSIVRDVIYIQDIKPSLLEIYDNGEEVGETSYYPELDIYFRWKKGFLNVFTGIPGHGKSTIVKQLTLIKSLKEGKKWGIFSPEEHPPYVFYDDLIHTLCGKNTSKNYTNRVDKQTYAEAIDFLKDRFFYIFPDKDQPTPELILNRFTELVQKHGIDGIIIDPFNQLDHNWGGGRDDLYLSTFLSSIKRFAVLNKLYSIIVAHPKSTITKDEKTGKYKCPDVYDMAHGAMWYNKSDIITVTHIPDREDTAVTFKTLKIKQQKLMGIPGEVTFGFNTGTHRYYLNGKSPFDCAENPFSQFNKEDLF